MIHWFDTEAMMKATLYGGDEAAMKEAAEINARTSAASNHGIWIDRAKGNRELLSDVPPASKLFNQWVGKDCVVVGAGDSMKRNLENIRTLQERGAKIVICERVWPIMIRNGIDPDVTITSDASVEVKHFFQGFPKHKSVLVNIITHPKAISMLKYRRESDLYAYGWVNPMSEISQKTYEAGYYPKEYFCLYPGLVIMATMVDFAYRMGCERVIMVGNDLGWKKREDIETMYSNAQSGHHIYTRVLGYDKEGKKQEPFHDDTAIMKLVVTDKGYERTFVKREQIDYNDTYYNKYVEVLWMTIPVFRLVAERGVFSRLVEVYKSEGDVPAFIDCSESIVKHPLWDKKTMKEVLEEILPMKEAANGLLH